MWNLDELYRTPRTYQAGGFHEEGVEAIFYEGLPFRGKSTRVFAWYGLPRHKKGEKVPGIVLVHGGGGTAFAEWVRLWNEHGYAAIAMDTCGCTAGGEHAHRPRHPFGGPPGWGGFDQIDWPKEDQWTYHAVADVILAHSLLRSFPDVDTKRIGLTGISWGGYLACIVAGVDARFCFVVPVYGCGFYRETAFGQSLKVMGKEKAAKWVKWWDPSQYLPNATMPMLWVSGSNDFAYWFPALRKSYRLAPGTKALSIRLRMPHSQEAGQSPREIFAFADSICKDGVPLPTITGHGRDGRQAWVTFESMRPIEKVELNYTCDGGPWPEREWKSRQAHLDENAGKASAELPPGTRCWYFNLVDKWGMVVSSEYEDAESPR